MMVVYLTMYLVQNPPKYDDVSSEQPLAQGVPKKIWFKLIFEFLTLGRVFLGVKNNSKNKVLSSQSS